MVVCCCSHVIFVICNSLVIGSMQNIYIYHLFSQWNIQPYIADSLSYVFVFTYNLFCALEKINNRRNTVVVVVVAVIIIRFVCCWFFGVLLLFGFCLYLLFKRMCFNEVPIENIYIKENGWMMANSIFENKCDYIQKENAFSFRCAVLSVCSLNSLIQNVYMYIDSKRKTVKEG